VWVFYSYFILPALRRRIPLGLAAGQQQPSEQHVCVYLPRLARDEHQQVSASLVESLQRPFQHAVVRKLTPHPEFHLEELNFLDDENFSSNLQTYTRNYDEDYIGVFSDRLDMQLQRLFMPSEYSRWLSTPNADFSGKEPAELLGSPETDRPLRDMILDSAYGLYL
jgi:hypothetical protein